MTGIEVLAGILNEEDGVKPKQFRVSLMRDNSPVMPELWLDVYVECEGNPYEERAFSDWLIRAKCTKAETPETADLVIFTGGTDVDSQLYGVARHSQADSPDTKRDLREMLLYRRCVEQGIPMLGICRGAQFLAVMNGAHLYQHVDNHNGAHTIYDLRKKQVIKNVSSVHHQMVIADPENGMEVLADTMVSKNRFLTNNVNRPGTLADVEAFWYRDTVSIGIQGHPEYRGYPEFSKWSLDLIEDLVVNNPDLDLLYPEGNTKRKFRRVKTELLEERKHVLKRVAPDQGVPKKPAVSVVASFDASDYELTTKSGSKIIGHDCKTLREFDDYAAKHGCTVSKRMTDA